MDRVNAALTIRTVLYNERAKLEQGCVIVKAVKEKCDAVLIEYEHYGAPAMYRFRQTKAHYELHPGELKHECRQFADKMCSVRMQLSH